MIKNERQYRITKSQAATFRQSLTEVRRKSASGTPEDLRWTIQENALKNQLADLETDLREYENLQTQAHGTMEIHSLEELPTALVKARIASGLTQKQLADKLGLKEQQVQRYEATGYYGANLSRIQEVLNALGARLRNQLIVTELPITVGSLLERMNDVGLNSEFVMARLFPPRLRAQTENGDDHSDLETSVFASASNIARIFDWEPAALFSSVKLQVPPSALSQARFKLPANARRSALPAYTVYAHFLALLLIQATPTVVPKAIPASWRHVRGQIIDRFGEINLLNVVRYIWDLGIVILPLNDSGQFHAATWRIRGRNVIVLKQQTASEGRWIIDLLHELWHAAQNQEMSEHAVIESDALYLSAGQLIEEQIATDFAADVVLKGRANEMAEQAAELSNHRTEWLKTAVQKVSRQNDVRVDILANYMAYRLSLEGQNWWGTAAKLQVQSHDPWECVRDIVAAHIRWDVLHGSDRQLLEQALQREEKQDENQS